MKSTYIVNNFEDIPFSNEIKDKIPVFALPGYAKFLEYQKGYKTIWFIKQLNSKSFLIIPFVYWKKFFVTKGMFLTSVININVKESLEKESVFIDEVIKKIKEKQLCHWIQQPPNWAIFNYIPEDSVYCKFGTYRIYLQDIDNEEELLQSFQSKNRQYIRKAIREGIEIKKGKNYLTDAINLINKTANDANLEVLKKQEIDKLIQLLDEKHVSVYVSYMDSIPQTSLISFSSRYAKYTIYAGAIDKPHKGANPYLYFVAIKDALIDKTIFFDFVGARINPDKETKQYGIQKFKSHFGTNLIEGYLWKLVINKSRYYIYTKAVKLYYALTSRDFNGDIIDQENKKENYE